MLELVVVVAVIPDVVEEQVVVEGQWQVVVEEVVAPKVEGNVA